MHQARNTPKSTTMQSQLVNTLEHSANSNRNEIQLQTMTDRQKTYASFSRKKTIRSIKQTTHPRHIEQLPCTHQKKLHILRNQTQESPHDTHVRQDWHQQVRQTGPWGRFPGVLREELYTTTTKTHKPSEEQSTNCRDSQIVIMYKSGNPSSPSIYRPMCLIPILYNIFSQLLFTGYSTTDHVHTFQQPRRRAAEWNQSLGAAAIDFQKALDSVEHCSILRALREQGIEKPYMQMLSRLDN